MLLSCIFRYIVSIANDLTANYAHTYQDSESSQSQNLALKSYSYMITKFSHQILLFFVRIGNLVAEELAMLAVDQSMQCITSVPPRSFQVQRILKLFLFIFWYSIRSRYTLLIYNPPDSGKIYQQNWYHFYLTSCKSYNNIVILGA